MMRRVLLRLSPGVVIAAALQESVGDKTIKNTHCDRCEAAKLRHWSAYHLPKNSTLRWTNTIPLDEGCELISNSAIWGNGGWRENALKYKLGGCCAATRNMFPEIYESLLRGSNVTECLVPPGSRYLKYRSNDLELTDGLSDVMVESPYHKYKTEFTIKIDEEAKGCFATIVDIVPKRKG